MRWVFGTVFSSQGVELRFWGFSLLVPDSVVSGALAGYENLRLSLCLVSHSCSWAELFWCQAGKWGPVGRFFVILGRLIHFLVNGSVGCLVWQGQECGNRWLPRSCSKQSCCLLWNKFLNTPLRDVFTGVIIMLKLLQSKIWIILQIPFFFFFFGRIILSLPLSLGKLFTITSCLTSPRFWISVSFLGKEMASCSRRWLVSKSKGTTCYI